MAESNVNTLETEILNRATKEGERLVERAKKIADRIVRQAERRKRETLSKYRSRAEQEATDYVKKMKSALRLELKRLSTQKELRIIDRILQNAEQEIVENLRKTPVKYENVLRDFIKEAVSVLDGDVFTVHISEADREMLTVQKLTNIAAKINTELGRNLNLSLSSNKDLPKMSGGVIVYTPDGKNCYNNSFEGRKERIKEDLRWEVFQKISEQK